MESATTDLLSDLEDEVVLEHASKGMRFVNFLIDVIVLWVIGAIIGVFIGAMFLRSYIADAEFGTYSEPVISSTLNMWLWVINYLIIVLYYTILEVALKGRTIGKLVTGTVALREDGSPLTFKNALMRSLVRIIPFEPLIALFTTYPWHDDFTNTVVVKKRA